MDILQKRQAILTGVLEHVPFDGWSQQALERGIADAGLSPADGLRAFPEGIEDCLEYFMEYADCKMHEGLSSLPLQHMRMHEKVGAAIMLRLETLLPYRECVRKAVAHYALPTQTGKALKRLYTTVDAIWRAVGDTPTDFSFYTKRMSLAAIYTSTLLFWLEDESENLAETHAFLQRRMANLRSFHHFKKNLRPEFLFRR